MKKIETLEDAQYFIDNFRYLGKESTTLYGVQSWSYERNLLNEDGHSKVNSLPVTITIDKQNKLTKFCYTNDVGRKVKELVPLTAQDIFEDREHINYALGVLDRSSGSNQ
ncbi:hypothetical protein [Desulfosporosinus sp. Sb-LF]|uniref:hypothetical protein n=1 Tax=Desulfosporosinus sp. Sb-LF TaxID=2560027 RepID=UPI00107F0019|nr:hypothetical protein [Desulfosporosinus sp. Sb-LF]TGE34400.1 hypothetical protein E4K68_01550 [Desulfosporosinus sp. Sb-LF]